MNNSFAEIHPELICEWSKNNDILPQDISYGSNKEVLWIGKCGHEWSAKVKSRSAGNGCPYCRGLRVLEGFNDVATICPSLISEWSDKNEMDIKEMTYGSSKKVWWKGECGHEWQASVKNRVNGSGCPFCSGNAVLRGFNDLQYKYPHIAKEWSEKNDLKPYQVLPNSNQKVWWKCKEGHEWKTVIAYRTSGAGCPICTNMRIISGVNDISITDPELAAEWSDKNISLSVKPVSRLSRKLYWWKCVKCGYEWEKSPYYRIHEADCPVCSNKVIVSGINDLATLRPEIASEWHSYRNMDLLPEMVGVNSSKMVWWHGKCGHDYRAKVIDRSSGSIPCKMCQKSFNEKYDREIAKYYLSNNQITYIEDEMEQIGLPLDLYIPSVRAAVIFQNKDYLSSYSVMREFVKNKACYNRRIRLVRIIGKDMVTQEKCISIVKQDNTREAVEVALNGLFEIIGLDMVVDLKKDEERIKQKYYNNVNMVV